MDVDADVQSLDLSSTQSSSSTSSSSHYVRTFNARKASERCRMMEGYVSFAAVEGLGTPPDGVDDAATAATADLDGDGNSVEKRNRDEEKRGRGLIGTWARRLFVGVGVGATTVVQS
jgi:hypothetical protein